MNLWRRLAFLGGQIGLMVLIRFFFQWIVKFADTDGPPDPLTGTSSVLLSASALATALLLFRIFDGITDPLAGMASDAWVRKGGQRRNLLWFSFLVPPLGLVLCFAPTHAMDPSIRWALVLSGMFVFFIGYTFYAIPYWSLVDDYSGEDPDERRRLSTLLGAGILLATAVAFVGSPALVEAYDYGAAAVVFAVPATFLMLLPWLAQPRGGSRAVHREEDEGILRSLKIAFAHRRFVAVLFLFSGSQMSFTVMTTAAAFIAIDLLGGTAGDVARLMAPFLGTAIPFFLLAPAISRRLGWEKGAVLASLALGGVYALTGGLGEGVIGSKWTTAGLLFACGGPMAALLLGLEGEAVTACARERGSDAVSVYFGVFNFVVKGLNGVAILLATLLSEAARGEWGLTAIRGMGAAAGVCLTACVLVYFAIRPRGPGAPAGAVGAPEKAP